MKYPLIKNLALTFIVFLSQNLTALAQSSSEGNYRAENGDIVLDIGKNCKSIPCEIRFGSAVVRILGGYVISNRNRDSLLYLFNDSVAIGEGSGGIGGELVIQSNLSINQIFVLGDSANLTSLNKSQESRKVVMTTVDYDKPIREGWVSLENLSERKQVVFRTHHAYATVGVKALSLKAGSAAHLADDMRAASSAMITAYQSVLEHLNDFRQIVAKDSSDSRHMQRLEVQLKSTLKSMVDEKGTPLLPVTHRKVTEGSRMIMVLSTVLEEITDKYDFNSRFLEPLKPAKDALSVLSRSIRATYGWEEGLAGSGSKALAALSMILESELRSMYSIVSSYSQDAQLAQTFNGLFRANSLLFNRVMASNAGDAAGTAAARDLLVAWNQPAFQQVLSGMMSAPKEAHAQLQNRILMALTAVESMKDYVDPKGDSKINVDIPANVRSKLN
jgi:hypothetical protein